MCQCAILFVCFLSSGTSRGRRVKRKQGKGKLLERIREQGRDRKRDRERQRMGNMKER